MTYGRRCAHMSHVWNRFLRKCSGNSGEWEDVGDDVAREKTSQVLRDAIQARKSFSSDRQKDTYHNRRLCSEQRRKDPPHKIKKTPIKQSLQPNLEIAPASQQSINRSLPLKYKVRDSVYSPDFLSFYDSCNSYGRVSIREPRHSREEQVDFSLTSLPYQYPVTPSSSNIAPSTGGKRQRFCHESPLIQDYHRYPCPTPIRRVNSPSTPPTSTLFKTPFNTRARGLNFSPTTVEEKADRDLSPSRCISKVQVIKKKHLDKKMVDVHPTQIQTSKATPEQGSYDNQEINTLLTDDVLSDPDTKSNPAQLFPSHQHDLIF